uniref:notochord granular surface isoform X2 n=1 Tax=Doryrhamphus excisus TaxID=161450 RepID=UPI0025AE236E|nr:notochord granular surface isoform X2 [Doryrhamphus excisus]
MSSSSERRSSYRRHFDSTLTDSKVDRVCSVSPTRHRSVSLTRRGRTMEHRVSSEKSRLTSASVCYGMSMGLGPKLDLDAAAAENQAFMATRAGEKQEMVALNDRLAAYIEKVRTLESKNKMLEAEIEALKSCHVQPSGLRQLYESQLKDLNRVTDQTRVQRDFSVAAKEAMLGQLNLLKSKFESAVEAQKKTESEINTLRPDVDKATSARITLEKQLENLEMEMDFLQRVQKEEIEELMQKISSVTSKIDLTFGVPDLASALKQIQSQYDCMAAKNLQDMDAWYKAKFQDLSDVSSKHVQSFRRLREEMGCHKKDILIKERELDALKTRNAYLEALIRDSLGKYKEKEQELQERIEALNLELKVTKEKIAMLLREHQDLLNVKMALEIEITTYRKLIEGEDHRLSTMVCSLSLSPASKTIVVSDSDPSPPLAADAPMMEAEGALSASEAGPEGASPPPERTNEDKAKETTERVRTDEDTNDSDTHEDTFSTSEAAAAAADAKQG